MIYLLGFGGCGVVCIIFRYTHCTTVNQAQVVTRVQEAVVYAVVTVVDDSFVL